MRSLPVLLRFYESRAMFLSVFYIAKTALRDGLKAIRAFRAIILAFLTKPVKASVKAISRKFATFLSGTVLIRQKPVSVHRVHRTLKADLIVSISGSSSVVMPVLFVVFDISDRQVLKNTITDVFPIQPVI